MGIVSHVLITNMRRPLLSHRVLIGCMAAIGRSQLHGLRTSHVRQRDESVLLAGILVPHSDHHHSRDHHRADVDRQSVWLELRINTASLFALGFISMFVSGGVSGFFLAQPSIDIMLHATYFVVGHFHMVMAVAAMFGIFAGTYFWFPKMTGRMMNETLGKIHFWLSFVGAYCIFMPFHYLGMAANIRRYQAFVDDYLQPLIPVHKFITVAAIVTGVAQLIFLYNLIHSRFWGKPAPDNPWEGDFAGVEHGVAAALRQLRRKASRGLPRSLPVWGAEFDGRLRHADFARAGCNRARREITREIEAKFERS